MTKKSNLLYYKRPCNVTLSLDFNDLKLLWILQFYIAGYILILRIFSKD